MKRSARPRKTPSRLSDSLRYQLSMYTLAATAGATLLTESQPAQAKIIFKATHRTLTNGMLPIHVAGTNFFNLTDKFYIITGSWSSQFLNINATGSAAVVGANGSASALKAGKVIGPKDAFQATKGLMAGAFCETQISSSRVFAPFANTTRRYLGLKFKLQGKVHYGWARFSAVTAHACNGGPAISATLTGYAYETIPGKPIIAGNTEEQDVITQHPASLGELALGGK